jgi:hypothetical protein
MTLPFTEAQFLGVFAAWNTAIWPLQFVALAAGVGAVFLLLTRVRWRDPAIAAILGALWLVNGIGYHWLFFAAINRAAWLFGALFVVAGLLFIAEGTIRRRLVFDRASGGRVIAAVALIGYAIAVYPLLGLLLTHPYPHTPLFGVSPCPTTIFTIGLLLLARHPRPWLIAGVPLAWCLVGGFAAIALGVAGDWALFAALVLWLVFRTSGRGDP